jgi:uncharacterized protein DUF1844
MDDDETKGFQVRDRRRFTETGEVREDTADDPREEQPQAEAEERKPPEPLPAEAEITLTTFLMSLSTQALMCLGEIPNPVDGKTETELPAVKELIDVISMLQDKTRGNVDPAEARLFEKILFDLRMRFVEKARKQSP